jgi:hypothetical protein
MNPQVADLLISESVGPILVCKFWHMDDQVKTVALISLLESVTSANRTLETHLVDIFSRGQRADFVKRTFPSLIPDGMSDAELADYWACDPGQVSRARTKGAMTLEKYLMALRLKPDNSESWPMLPSAEIGFLAGMAHAVPWMRNTLCSPTDQETRNYPVQDDLCLWEAAILQALINDHGNLNSWFVAITESHGDPLAMCDNSRFRSLLSDCLSDARELVKTDPAATTDLNVDIALPKQRDAFCIRLVELWNRLQFAWVLTDEAIRHRMQ